MNLLVFELAGKMKRPVIYIRRLRYEEARHTLLTSLEKYFSQGVREVEVIHGIGTYTLRKMVLAEIEKMDYVNVIPGILGENPGTLRLELLSPEEHILNSYIDKVGN